MTTDTIKEKIKKLLRLASNNPNPHEAAAALQKAHELMEQHGIKPEMAQQANCRTSEPIPSVYSGARPTKWEIVLIHGIADLMNCKVVWTAHACQGQKGFYTLYGMDHKVEYANHFSIFLLRTAAKARKEFLKTVPEWYNKKAKAYEADSFCYGWACAVREQLDKLLRNEEEKQIVAIAYENYAKEQGIVKTSGPQRHIGSQHYASGYEAGSQVRLHRPVNA